MNLSLQLCGGLFFTRAPSSATESSHRWHKSWAMVKLTYILHRRWLMLNLRWSDERGEPTATLFCLISVGYHSQSCVAITFHRRYRFLPIELYHILPFALNILYNVIWYVMSLWTLLGSYFLWISEEILSWMMDEFIHYPKPYLLMSRTCRGWKITW
jgi:hypothetical protein